MRLFYASLTALMIVFLCWPLSTRAEPALLLIQTADAPSATRVLREKMMDALVYMNLQSRSASDYLIERGLLANDQRDNEEKIAASLAKYSNSLKDFIVLDIKMRSDQEEVMIPTVDIIQAKSNTSLGVIDTFPIPNFGNGQLDIQEIEAAAYGLASIVHDRLMENSENGQPNKSLFDIRLTLRGTSTCQRDYITGAIRDSFEGTRKLEILRGRASNLVNYNLQSSARPDDIASWLTRLLAHAGIYEAKHYEIINRAQFIELRFYPAAASAFSPCH